jgi:hypothetical protein
MKEFCKTAASPCFKLIVTARKVTPNAIAPGAIVGK